MVDLLQEGFKETSSQMEKIITESKAHVSTRLIEVAQNILRSMVLNNQKEMVMPKPFHGFKVVIGNTEKSWFPVPIPDDLKEKVSETVTVTTKN